MSEAVAYFRHRLGDHWRGWQQRSHLARIFHLAVQGQVREWVRLHELMKALDDLANVELVVADLAGPAWQRHVAAEQAIEFCGRMRTAGHRVELCRPSQRRTADARVWLDDRPVSIEFKALHESDERTVWDDFVERLHSELHHRRLGLEVFPFEIEFLHPALNHLTAIADALVAIAKRGDRDVHLLPHGAGCARFVSDASGLRTLQYPAEQRPDLERIRSSLGGRYRRQLRIADEPTLLVVLTQHAFFVRPDRVLIDAQRTADSLAQGLVERTGISGVLLHEEPLQAPAGPVLHVSSEWCFAADITEGRARSSLFVHNRGARVALAAREVETLIGSRRCW